MALSCLKFLYQQRIKFKGNAYLFYLIIFHPINEDIRAKESINAFFLPECCIWVIFQPQQIFNSEETKPNKTNKHISSYQRNSFNELKSYYRKRNMEVFGTQKGQDKILCCSILFVSTQPINYVNFLNTPNIKYSLYVLSPTVPRCL